MCKYCKKDSDFDKEWEETDKPGYIRIRFFCDRCGREDESLSYIKKQNF